MLKDAKVAANVPHLRDIPPCGDTPNIRTYSRLNCEALWYSNLAVQLTHGGDLPSDARELRWMAPASRYSTLGLIPCSTVLSQYTSTRVILPSAAKRRMNTWGIITT